MSQIGPKLLAVALSLSAPGARAAAAPPSAAELAARMGSATPLDHAAYAALKKVSHHRAWLPVSVDLTARFPKPGDQLFQGACTAWATGYAARSFLSSAELGRAPQSPDEIVSPEYIYNRIRPGGLQTCMTAGKVTDALDLLATEGAATLAEFPYSMSACHQPPPAALKIQAARWRIRAWRAVDHETPDDWRTPINLDDVKGQLAQGLPVIFTMPVPNDFFTKTGDAIYSHTREASDTAFHAMALVGYDDNRQAIRLINSWGPDWGDHGYAWIDYATFKAMATEAYVIEPLGTQGGTQVSPLAQAVAARAETVGDPDTALATLLSSPGCGQVVVGREGGRRMATGFLGSDTDLAFLKSHALAIDPALDWQVELRRWPQCEADLTLQKTIEASPVRLAIGDAAGTSGGTGPTVLRQGQLFSISVETTASLPFVHVIYLQADGSAVELYRNAPSVGPDGRRRTVIGAGGKAGVRFQVTAPYGDEMVIALAGTGPLFDDRLGSQATERQFLTMLRTRLVRAREDGQPISGAIARIHTTN